MNLGSNKFKSNLLIFIYIGANMFNLADSGFFKNFYNQGDVKSTVSWVFEDLKKLGSEPLN